VTLPQLRTLLLAVGGLLLGVALGVAYFLFSSKADIAGCSTALQDSVTAPDSSLRGLLYRTTCRDQLGASVDVLFDDPHAALAVAHAGAPRLGSIPVGTGPTEELGLAWRSSDTLVVLKADTVVGTWRRIRDPQSGRLVLVRLPPRRSN
jgi:hypothetical protein